MDDKTIKSVLEMRNLASKGICPFCNIRPKLHDFRDALSFKEFSVSGLCQDCQDGFFEEPPSDYLAEEQEEWHSLPFLDEEK